MKPVALGANIFAGGFSLGVSKHFKLLGHLEHDDYGAAVSSKNLKVPIYVGTDQWPDKLPVRKLDFLYSNPPCAIWSVASGRDGDNWRHDPRLQRIRDIFALVKRYQPDVWCWESVCQAFSKGREFVEELADEAKKLGYSATYLLIDAAYLGTPQHRKRFFLVLHKVAIDWKAPPFRRVHGGQPAKLCAASSRTWTRITKLSNQVEGKILKHTKPGELLSRVYDRIIKKPKIGSARTEARPAFVPQAQARSETAEHDCDRQRDVPPDSESLPRCERDCCALRLSAVVAVAEERRLQPDRARSDAACRRMARAARRRCC
jgi:site-specific DNA-cytosine methylase